MGVERVTFALDLELGEEQQLKSCRGARARVGDTLPRSWETRANSLPGIRVLGSESRLG